MNNLNNLIDKNKILFGGIDFNEKNITLPLLIDITKKYNKYNKDKIKITDNITKNDLLNILLIKLNNVNEDFFNKTFINKNDMINFIIKYNNSNLDKISYNKNMNFFNLLNILKKKFNSCNDDLCVINELNRNKSNKKEIKEFTKDENTKCAPHLKYEDGSCYTMEKLLEMAKIYNQKFKNDPNYERIVLTNDITKSQLINYLSQRLNNCNNQICWLSKIYKNKKDITQYFRPPGPTTRFKWLNTTNINLVMKQYEKKYDDFKFYGAVPIDFDNPMISDILFIDYNDLFNKGITRIGFIFNLDRHDQSGSHWIALYCNLDKKLIYFFDSYGTNPYKDDKYKNISILMSRIGNYLNNSLSNDWSKSINNLYEKYNDNNIDYCVKTYKNNIKLINQSGSISNNIDFNYYNNKNIDINFANIRHQYANSECGVYSIYFILNMLLDDNNFYNNFYYDKLDDKNDVISGKKTFKRIDDNVVNKCRDEYFNFTDIIIDNSF